MQNLDEKKLLSFSVPPNILPVYLPRRLQESTMHQTRVKIKLLYDGFYQNIFYTASKVLEFCQKPSRQTCFNTDFIYSFQLFSCIPMADSKLQQLVSIQRLYYRKKKLRKISQLHTIPKYFPYIYSWVVTRNYSATRKGGKQVID